MSDDLQQRPSGRHLLRALEVIGLSPHAEDDGTLVALCPVCYDQSASLRVTTTPPTPTVLCRLGCSIAHVLEELSQARAHIHEPGAGAAFHSLVYLASERMNETSTLALASTAPWPVMPIAAFYGPLGEAARAIEPLSEADPAAVLVQLIVAFGSAVGRGPRIVLGSLRQFANLFAVVVGKSSKSRKGTSWENAAEVLSPADESWWKQRIRSGLSSGEGVIHAVRDPLMAREMVREGGKRGGRVVEYQDVEQDPGESDKRLLVVESEFARTLKVAGRKESILSAVLRDAWDTGNLSVLTKAPYKSTGAHISIIGHVTKDELRRELTTCDSFNGFANRFLWVCARRSKELPFGERRIGDAAATVSAQLAAAIGMARARGEFVVDMDGDARSWWKGLYSDLSADRPGLLGGVLGRAEPLVLRLALIFVLADAEDVIRRPHLEAALAVWRYCEASARTIFGDALGDPIADEILRVLRETPEGMTRDDLRNHFDRNVGAARLTQALDQLAEKGMATARKEPPQGGRGRPAERWSAGRAANAENVENVGRVQPAEPNGVNGVNRVGVPQPEVRP